jgi:hypothetical protein
MAEMKTTPTNASVEAFLESIPDEGRRSDSRAILELMRDVTGSEPKIWGENIVGFGDHHYKYASGREGDWFKVGFSPRKQNLTLYLTYGYEQHTELMQNLGKYKMGKACLYIKKLADVDLPTLRRLIELAAATYAE